MVHEVVRFAQIKYYEDEIGRLLMERQELLAKEDEAQAKVLGERIMDLIWKLEELR